MATLDHPSFLQPSNPNVLLWRYMDLSKFAALLQRGALAFPRADLLGDRFEGSVPVANANGRFLVEALLQNPNNSIDLTEERLSEIGRQLSDNRRLWSKIHFVSCWHMNSYESAAMWKLYSSSRDAVCIQTSYSKLANALPSECYMGTIRYIDFATSAIHEGNAFNSFLIKRLSFSHEQEARAIAINDAGITGNIAPDFLEFPVDIQNLINAIFVSPDAPSWYREVVQGLTSKYGLSLTVHSSTLDGEPMY